MPSSTARAARTAAFMLALLAMPGCSLLTEACTSELGVDVDPDARTVRVGESFTAELTFLGCGGKERLGDTITWSTADAAVASVQPATGRVTGVAPGETTVTGSGARYGDGPAVRVTVVAR